MSDLKHEALEADLYLANLRISTLEAKLDKALTIIEQACRLSADMDEDIMKNREALDLHHSILHKLIDEGERMDGDLAALTERVSDPLYRLGF